MAPRSARKRSRREHDRGPLDPGGDGSLQARRDQCAFCSALEREAPECIRDLDERLARLPERQPRRSKVEIAAHIETFTQVFDDWSAKHRLTFHEPHGWLWHSLGFSIRWARPRSRAPWRRLLDDLQAAEGRPFFGVPFDRDRDVSDQSVSAADRELMKLIAANPAVESISDFRRRAELHYTARARFLKRRGAVPREPYPALVEHARWLVLYQVPERDMDVADIQVASESSRRKDDLPVTSTIEGGYKSLAKRLGLRLRPSRKGRRRAK